MHRLILFLVVLKISVAMHTLEFLDFQCISSSKKSAEVSNCENNGKYLAVDINFLRPLNDWQVMNKF